LRKCDSELSGSTLPIGGIVSETSRAPLAVDAKMSAGVPASAPAFAPAAAPDAVPAAIAKNVEAKDTSKEIGNFTISGRKPIRREWYQNNTHVYITIFAKNVEEKTCKVDFQDKECSISFPLPGGTDNEEYQLDLSLFEAVERGSCRLDVSKVKVEVVLCKKEVGLHWRALEQQEEVTLATPQQPAQPSYPSSSVQKRDWSKIDYDIDQELKNEKPEGDAALNKLFKEIYERADPDTRRAMNKSFQTSGGTVLSTNWGEVARSDYEGKDRPTAPEGQEWRDSKIDK